VDQIEGANATANALGWQAVWQPARLTEKDGASGGVAIFARAMVGITQMGIVTDHPSRLVAARIEAPGNQVFACISCYLDASLKGLKGGKGTGKGKGTLKVLATTVAYGHRISDCRKKDQEMKGKGKGKD
jgi:hypothetical protein